MTPQRAYTGHHPPRPRDHLLAHPYETVIAAAGAAAGAAAIAGEAIPGVSVSPSIEGLAWVVAWIVGLTGVIGNVLVLLGLFDDGDDLMRGWRRERMGLTLAISSWGAYALAVAASYPSALISWGFPAAIAVGHAVRLVASYDAERATRRAVTAHEGGPS